MIATEYYAVEATHAIPERGPDIHRLMWTLNTMPGYEGKPEPIKQAVSWGLLFGGRVALMENGRKILDFDADKATITTKVSGELHNRIITLIID